MSHHHLTPKYIGHIDGMFVDGRNRKDKTPMCKDCHETIHFCFTNEELYKDYNTLVKLKEGLVERLIEITFEPFMFMIENGAVPPTGLEELPCKRIVEGSSPFSALWVCSIPVIISGCQPDESGSTPDTLVADVA